MSKKILQTFVVTICTVLMSAFCSYADSQNVEPVIEVINESTIVEPKSIKPTIVEIDEPEVFASYESTPEEIEEENRLGDMELLAQLCQAEAGNQGLTGMRYVADVVLNRVESDKFPNTIQEVIYQDNQLSVIKNGAFDRAGWYMSEDAYQAVELEWYDRLDSEILYFSSTEDPANGINCWKYLDHWFGY